MIIILSACWSLTFLPCQTREREEYISFILYARAHRCPCSCFPRIFCSFLREDWVFALYHDRFSRLRQNMVTQLNHQSDIQALRKKAEQLLQNRIDEVRGSFYGALKTSCLCVVNLVGLVNVVLLDGMGVTFVHTLTICIRCCIRCWTHQLSKSEKEDVMGSVTRETSMLIQQLLVEFLKENHQDFDQYLIPGFVE